MNYQLTGSKEDMISSFIDLLESKKLPRSNHKSVYTGEKVNRRNTVDGNPTAAYKMCHPYTGTPAITGKIGLNGKIGSGRGTYGD